MVLFWHGEQSFPGFKIVNRVGGVLEQPRNCLLNVKISSIGYMPFAKIKICIIGLSHLMNINKTGKMKMETIKIARLRLLIVIQATLLSITERYLS